MIDAIETAGNQNPFHLGNLWLLGTRDGSADTEQRRVSETNVRSVGVLRLWNVNLTGQRPETTRYDMFKRRQRMFQ